MGLKIERSVNKEFVVIDDDGHRFWLSNARAQQLAKAIVMMFALDDGDDEVGKCEGCGSRILESESYAQFTDGILVCAACE